MEGPTENENWICLSASAGNDAIPQRSCLGYSPIILRLQIYKVSDLTLLRKGKTFMPQQSYR